MVLIVGYRKMQKTFLPHRHPKQLPSAQALSRIESLDSPTTVTVSSPFSLILKNH